ncbi:hypothetical protein PPGU19_048000 [Paraburkholderia sp. PGU19]|uniref:hypothetical protein n=1 Tax=Paraburkholderia sp. PGU19 TaxID=2735434 RepID=UPI0015D99037|nr:hypothetical protein [Paraburkholderia sp. PGU19]BCG00232.1 hypothetical protein PPGU19_048000 [Paraburkholderia sp. PGU19]
MSAGRKVDAENPSAAELIIRAAEDHAPDANRMLVLVRLGRLVKDDDCLVYPSVEWVAHHTRLGVATVERIFAELRKFDILQWTGDVIGKMGTKVYRIQAERIAAAYPPPEPWEERQARSQARFRTIREKYRAKHSDAPSHRGSVDSDAPSHRGSVTGANGSTLPHGEGHAPSRRGSRSLK